ncbi:uncharacterized protein PGTG_17531 [Puccinia graminis f. sp. tritici CRL 75-36-700-3]|uniref:Sugar phosphate transporter domain-containing protein n=1 Tax=Puccinia graminis f. sp. tritici (strain CRL 75-36-700-3 / race SCCL) TaxID=418459 RepID=E3L550_PUCGT|nr:uncharacterized protein PGTG_17531 [Puccinia graminis f. sp. tritici CRL 75-36-700-3]EFP91675.2 hypothetical protein PGTG_17531 [Puccinia graminis f. sp. tritici CRL 75-36-700-3]
MHHTKQLSHSSILFIGTTNPSHSNELSSNNPELNSSDPAHANRSSLTLIVTITLSASLTLLNKSIYTTFQFPYPFYLLALHFASISLTSRIVAKTFRPAELDAYHERVTWRFWSRNVLTVGLAYGSAILCSNLAYLSLSVSFVQMLKAFTPVILVIATAFLDHRLPPMRTALVVMTISSGVAIAAYGEIQFVLIGVLFQLAGSLAEVARLIATQRLLQDLSVDPLVALSALSPICFSMALVLAPIFEGSEPIFLMVPRMGIPLIIGSILLALALNIVVLFLVSSTNALVLTLAGIVKDICLILGSVVFLGSHVTTTQVLGYSLAASGLVYFKFSVPPGSPKPPNWSPRSNEARRYEALPLNERESSNGK